MKTLQFDLLNNAKDSLTHAVHLLVWDDRPPSNPYKHAILSLFHCAELLLKERLRRVSPALIWEDVDKYPSITARTVGVDKAVARLSSMGNVTISEKDKGMLVTCRNLRNFIQHFEFQIPETEAKVLLGQLLSFVFSFSESELSIELDLDFKADDTWVLLCEQFTEFASQHGSRIAEIMMKAGAPIGSCSYCGQDTVDLIWEACSLCGQAHELSDDEKRYRWR